MKKLLSSLFAAVALMAFPMAANAGVVDLNATAGQITQPTILSQAHSRFQNSNMFEKGDNLGAMIATVTAGASDSNTSTYRVFNNLDPGIVPLMILIGNTLNTAGTSYSLGTYAGSANGAVGGAAVSANALMNAQTMASARASLVPGVALDGMSNVGVVNFGKALWSLSGDAAATTRPLGYDLTLTANTAGSAGGTMTVLMIYAVPQAPPQ